jgi:hypothetical protein
VGKFSVRLFRYFDRQCSTPGGTKHSKYVTENVAAGDVQLTAAESEELAALLPPHPATATTLP